MEIILVIAVAYVLTGARYVLQDLRQPLADRRLYAIKFRRWGFLVPLFDWLPGTVMVAFMTRFRLWKEAVSMLILFASLSLVGIAVLYM